MRLKRASLVLIASFLPIASAALASTSWYVNGISGSDSNNCTLAQTACKTIGHAISLATSGDSIRVAAAVYKENLSIGFNLNILGSSAVTTSIDGGSVATVVTISSASAHVTLSGLTIRNGLASTSGGGISNLGTLALINSSVGGNTVATECVEFCAAWGGGIYNFPGGTVTISNSTVSGNLAYLYCRRGGCFAAGGGIYNKGTMRINNTTLSGNTAHEIFNGADNLGQGGGIYNKGTMRINNSTLSGNIAFVSGGGIESPGSTTLQNSIVANSSSGGNCGGTVTSNGYNLSSDATCNFAAPGDLNNTNPMLGPLQNNGGPTPTMALLPGSPAIDTGNPTGCTDGKGHLLKTDQRGKPRPDKEETGGCDIGAYESQSD